MLRKIAIARRSVVARINRKLSKRGTFIKACGNFWQGYGPYVEIDATQGVIRTPQVNLEALARELGALADYEVLEPDEPDAIPDASEEPVLSLDPDFPSMVEACARLDALQIPFKKCTDSHLKIGSLNYYPRRGITCLDGALNSYPTKGFTNLLQIVHDVAGIKTSGTIGGRPMDHTA